MDISEKFTDIDLVCFVLSCAISRKKRIIPHSMKSCLRLLNTTSGILRVVSIRGSWDETGMKLAELWTAFEIAFCERKAVVFVASFL